LAAKRRAKEIDKNTKKYGKYGAAVEWE